MSFVPLNLLQKPPQNALGSLLGGAVGGYGAIQKLRAQNVLNQLHKAQAQSAQAQAGIAPQLAAAQVARIPLAQQLLQAQIAKAKRIPVQGAFAQNLQGIFNIAKAKGLNPQQTGQLLDQFARSQQKKGISLGFGAGGGLSSLNIGGSAGTGGTPGVAGGTGILAPTNIVPNSGQTSRGTQGALKIDANTGKVTSIPTRRTGGFLQAGVVGNQKFQAALKDYQKGMAPYVGVWGKAKMAKDLAQARLEASGEIKGKEATNRLGDYSKAKALRVGLATDAGRMTTGGVPGTAEIGKWFQALNPHWWSNPEIFQKKINGLSSMGNKWQSVTQKGLTGIPVEQLSPNETQMLQQANQIGNAQIPLSKIFYPDEQIAAQGHATTEPVHLVNGQPHLKPHQTAGVPHLNQGLKTRGTQGAIERPRTAAQAAKPTGTIKIRLPDGRVGSVPANRLDQAIKMGAKRV